MARRPRTPSPAALAALGLVGMLGTATPAVAQEDPAPETQPLAPAPEESGSTEPPRPTVPLAEEPPAPADAPPEPPPAPAEPPAAAPAEQPPAVAAAVEVPPPAAPPAAPAPAVPVAPAAPKKDRGQEPGADEDAAEGPPARRKRRRREQAPATDAVHDADVAAPRRPKPAARRRPARPPRTPVQATTATPQMPAPLVATPTGDDPLAAVGSVELRGALLRRYRIPPFLLPIYQAAGTQYGIRWEILAAINEIETDYGRNLNVSSAGAQGWMQFMPATWKAYGTDANRDGRRDPYNPVDAIFAAARYLDAAGASENLRKAIFAYNHADWYVESVLLRARLIAELPTAFVDGVTGLTQGRFPVAGDVEIDRVRPVHRGQRTDVVAAPRRGAVLFTEPEAPVLAVQDGEVVAIGESARLGRHLILEDAYGNRYTYARLSRVERTFTLRRGKPARGSRGTVPSAPRERELPPGKERLGSTGTVPSAPAGSRGTVPSVPRERELPPGKERLVANAYRAEQPVPVEAIAPPGDVRALRVGSRVPSGTVLGRAGRSARSGKALVRFEIRPSGRRAPRLDPVPFLEGYRLLSRSGMDRRLARAGGRRSIGQVLLMGKDALRKRVLSDERIVIGGCMREDVRSGVIDRRVLATLAMLAESGLNPTVTSLRCNHGVYTAGGNVSHHSTGTAVDIGAINGTRIEPGTQGTGSITERTIRRLLTLQGSMAPSQIISLMSFEGAPSTLSMPDHADHIHVGWRPAGDGHTTGRREALAGSLAPEQWRRVADRLTTIDNPALRD